MTSMFLPMSGVSEEALMVRSSLKIARDDHIKRVAHSGENKVLFFWSSGAFQKLVVMGMFMQDRHTRVILEQLLADCG